MLTAVPVDDTDPPALEDGLPNVTVGLSEAATHSMSLPWVSSFDVHQAPLCERNMLKVPGARQHHTSKF